MADNICIPIHLDAFAISPGCCSSDIHDASLAPYTQPNYTSLRLDSHLIRHDVLEHVDMHLTAPATRNPRLADLSRPPGKNLKRRRMGVNLSWSLPRCFRSAQASGKTSKSAGEKDKPNPNLQFRPFPNRWLVVRQIINGNDQGKLKPWQSWIVESDTRRFITHIDPSTDLESDVAPFVSYDDSKVNEPDVLDSQTEVFLGQKLDIRGWKEDRLRDFLPSLTVMSSANPLFADYTMHNSNVLSIIDDFSYADGLGTGFLDSAECNYFVFGWHSLQTNDPFSDPTQIDLASRLSSLLLQFQGKYQDPVDSTATAIRTDERQRRCILHGAIYNVKYDFNYVPQPTTSPLSMLKSQVPENLANTSARKFTQDEKMEPLSIGTTPLDGILTFLEAHKDKVDEIFDVQGASTLADSLMNIAQLLYAVGDNYDSRVRAQDLIAQQNFSKVEGGLKWVFAKTTEPGKPAIVPSDQDKIHLRGLNETQTKLDTARRQLAAQKWELFAEWWKQVSKFIPLNLADQINGKIKSTVDDLRDSIGAISSHVQQLEDELKRNIDTTISKAAACDPFRLRQDPTLVIAGLGSGWPDDWQDLLTIQLQRDLATDDNIADTIFKESGSPEIKDAGLSTTMRRLLTECVQKSNTTNGARDPVTGIKQIPKTLGFQSWGNQNPFVPIFIEWEGIYYHIGPNEETSQKWKLDEKWQVKVRASPVGHLHSTVRYVPTERLSSKDENHKDMRAVSGRVLVLPQPVFSLQTLVKSVLDTASQDLRLTKDEQKDLKTNIGKLQFVSAPLSGLTNHLITRYEGAHVKPLVRKQGDRVPTPMKTAIREEIDMNMDILRLTEAESATTPYGDSFPFGTDQFPGTPFKPVTHGQMILTKINIVDKFGQVISLPKMLRQPRQPPELPTSNIYPSLSDWLSPDVIEDNGFASLNTVLPTKNATTDGQWPLCQYIQLTPSINQDARINGAFVVRDTVDKAQMLYSRFREASEYDPIIWGWVIINYADNGLQFFTGDGKFYREIRRGGVSGTNVSQKWLPYDPPPNDQTTPRDANEAQLAAFINTVQQPAYFQKFCDVINGGIKNMPFLPSDYSAYASAIVGKPLALVNCGWSLELAAPAIKSQNTIGNAALNVEEVLSNYSFPLKLGDVERNYDGVVGYWNTDDSPSTATTHWEKMYTYFATDWDNLPAGTVLQLPGTTLPRKTYTVLENETLSNISNNLQLSVDDIKRSNPMIHDPSPASDQFTPINPQNYITLKPYHLDARTDNLLQAKTDKMKITTMLIDPYTSVHGYSPILPDKTLTLPRWSIQTAFENMHAFFHLGPMLLTTDVPTTRSQAELPDQVVKLPVSGHKGTWTWFQPYVDHDDDDSNLDPTYAQIPVVEDLGVEKYVKPPYTFVEGFLQLEGNLGQKSQAQQTVA